MHKKKFVSNLVPTNNIHHPSFLQLHASTVASQSPPPLPRFVIIGILKRLSNYGSKLSQIFKVHFLSSLAALLSVLIVGGQGVYAQSVAIGLEAAQKGDFALALGEWQPLADQGDADAQFYVGVLHFNGYGVTQDRNAAEKWYRLAAEQGLARAQFNLGVMFFNGYGVVQNYSEAGKWYRLSAQQGEAQAQNNLGYMYWKGEGVQQDYLEAMTYFRLSAAQGHGQAQFSLGWMYWKGEGVVQDDVFAHMWFSIAESQGHDEGKKNRIGVEMTMTANDIAKAQLLVRDCVALNFKGC